MSNIWNKIFWISTTPGNRASQVGSSSTVISVRVSDKASKNASLATAAAVYLSYGLSRILSMASDGVPHSGLVSAAVIEVAIGAVCFVDLVRHRRVNVARRIAVEDARYATTEEDPI